jgi:hypothetical protein
LTAEEQLHFHHSLFPFILHWFHLQWISCSSFQAHNNYSSFTVWSPRRSELVAKCFLSGRLFFAQLWCVLSESANRVCFCYCQFCQFCQFCQHSFLLSSWVCIVCVPPRCFQLFEQGRFILVASIL